jgi:hypothetical protein
MPACRSLPEARHVDPQRNPRSSARKLGRERERRSHRLSDPEPLPFGVFRRRGSREAFRGGVAIGDRIVDLAAVVECCDVVGGRAPAKLSRCSSSHRLASSRLRLPEGEERAFLADGDTLTLRGFAERAGARRIGFGECSGTVLPASPSPG